jgi:hypothetical protein
LQADNTGFRLFEGESAGDGHAKDLVEWSGGVRHSLDVVLLETILFGIGVLGPQFCFGGTLNNHRDTDWVEDFLGCLGLLPSSGQCPEGLPNPLFSALMECWFGDTNLDAHSERQPKAGLELDGDEWPGTMPERFSVEVEPANGRCGLGGSLPEEIASS